MKRAQLVGAATGIALMAAPALAGYADAPAADFHRTVGPVAASIAIVAMWDTTHSLRWLNVGAGLMLMGGPLFASHPGAAAVIGDVAGLLLLAVAVVDPPAASRFGGGWRTLFGSDSRG